MTRPLDEFTQNMITSIFKISIVQAKIQQNSDRTIMLIKNFFYVGVWKLVRNVCLVISPVLHVLFVVLVNW